MDESGRQKDDGLSDTARDLQGANRYLGAVWKFTGGLLVGCLAGYFVDRGLHTSPWGLLALGVAGAVGGFWLLTRELAQLEKKT